MADVAVAHGKDRAGLVAALTAAEQAGIAQRIGVLVDHKGFPQGPKFGGEGRHGFGPGGPALGVRVDPFQAAATYLGISTADLQTKMRSGQTLAQIATATPNKTRDGLITAIVDDQTAKIDQAVKDNNITADMATKIKTGLQDRVTRLVDHTGPAGGFFVPRGPHL
jgi:hypothetical protein